MLAFVTNRFALKIRFFGTNHKPGRRAAGYTRMAHYSITTRHRGVTAFEAEIGSHKVVMDNSASHGDEDLGPSPKRVFLSALAGCTGMDVVSLLRKMRVPFSDFEILTEADLTEEHPRVFSHVEIVYRIRVDESYRDKVEKAVNLSAEKYCGVTAMLRKNSPVEHRIEYL